MSGAMEIFKEIINAIYKLGRQNIIFGLLAVDVYLAHVESSALSPMIAVTVSAITQYFQLKAQGDGNAGSDK